MIADTKIKDFLAALSSAEPTPGGGGASALTGSVAASLAGMVASLTLNSKKYEEFHDEIREIKTRADELRDKLIELADIDAEAFAPLAAAYRIPKDDPNRAETLETALAGACTPPLTIMRLCANTMELFPILREKGTKMAVSDVDAGEVLCRAAINAASYNVYINTKLMRDKNKADELNKIARKLVD
ncbi:MAG: cyclodeaminase/cyclohydrolase family protein [Oscillospiraceae bacterium]|nr:cyclodeaminase/cyclohydrolase family protein [Oscillospiraceae bacterium]